MQSLLNKSARIGDKLIKQTVNVSKINYDIFNRRVPSSRLLTYFRPARNFHSIWTNQRSHFHSSLVRPLLTSTRLGAAANRPPASPSNRPSDHAYSSHLDGEYTDLVDQTFQTTRLSFTNLPKIYLPKHFRGKKMSAANGTAKWHLKNIFYLLKTNYEEEEENRKPINNRFDVLTDYTRCLGDFWECTITVSYPNKQFFKAKSRRKQEAENNASQLAMQWLKDQGIFLNFIFYLNKIKLAKMTKRFPLFHRRCERGQSTGRSGETKTSKAHRLEERHS